MILYYVHEQRSYQATPATLSYLSFSWGMENKATMPLDWHWINWTTFQKGLGLNKFLLYDLQGQHNFSQGDSIILCPVWSLKPPDLASTDASSQQSQDIEVCSLCSYQPSPVLKARLHHAPQSMKLGRPSRPLEQPGPAVCPG